MAPSAQEPEVAEALRASLDQCPCALAAVASDGTIRAVNAPFAALLGEAEAALVGRRLQALCEGAAEGRACFGRLEDEGRVDAVALRRADGGRLWVRWSKRDAPAGLRVIGLEDVTAGREAEAALAELRAELEDAHSRLVQSEKMASLGMLVAGIAHEINTPIGAVSSMHATLVLGTQKLEKALAAELDGGLDAHPKVGKVLGILEDANRVIADGSGRVMNIVRRLKSFARLDEAELEQVRLEDGIEDTLTLIHHELKRDVTVHRDFADVGPVACFPGRLNQVFLNLLMNAKQAMPEGGDIWVKTWADDTYTYASIRDSGVGISQENLQKVFDPGFTTKGVGVGTGLGLSICRQIVQEHFGDLTVTSTPGGGSTFCVRIPHDVKAQHEARRAASKAQAMAAAEPRSE